MGVLVDNGTVVIDNIERHVGLGDLPEYGHFLKVPTKSITDLARRVVHLHHLRKPRYGVLMRMQ
jgi:hypothetical protein